MKNIAGIVLITLLTFGCAPKSDVLNVGNSPTVVARDNTQIVLTYPNSKGGGYVSPAATKMASDWCNGFGKNAKHTQSTGEGFWKPITTVFFQCELVK